MHQYTVRPYTSRLYNSSGSNMPSLSTHTSQTHVHKHADHAACIHTHTHTHSRSTDTTQYFHTTHTHTYTVYVSNINCNAPYFTHAWTFSGQNEGTYPPVQTKIRYFKPNEYVHTQQPCVCKQGVSVKFPTSPLHPDCTL